MAAVLNIDTECLARLEQYEDDSVEAWFTDGTKISMAACGGAFTRQAKPKTGPDPFGRLTSGETSTLHQFTAYAARECRERVRALLAFRNLFAEQPFLPSSLLIKEIEVSGCAVDYGVWPLNLRQATGQNLFETNSTGGTRLQASDGRAWAEMAGHGQTLTTCYPARLSGGRGSRSDERESLEDCLAGLELKRNRGECVWRREVHSTASIPPHWEHPLSLLLQHRSRDSHVTTSTPDKENERTDAVVSAPLPHTLPLSCPHQQLHHTRHENLRLRVLFTEGVIYRVFFDQPHPFVEALPNQSTVLRSHDRDGRFFNCWSLDEASGSGHPSMHCVDHTPISSGLHPFSMARVISQASRLLSQVLKLRGSKVKLCWKAPSTPPSPPSSPFHYTVPGLGRFTVRANGHVRCVFSDRTIVDFFNPHVTQLNSDLSRGRVSGENLDPSSGGYALNSSCPPGSVRGRGVEVASGVRVDRNWCRVLQPNGRYVMLSTNHPSSHQRYIEVVREWCDWLAQQESKRGHFHQKTIYNQQTQREVLAELSKIERFTAIMTSQVPDDGHMEKLCGLVGGRGQSIEGHGKSEVPPFVKDALRQTGKVVQDIDTILGK